MSLNNLDLISVIVPVYKVEKYLDKCITSIVNQTYSNIEIILIDDGSPDNCPQMCDEWSKNDNRIKVVHKINGGLSDARNVGIEIAKGEYLVFVDSDDKIEPEMIQLLYEAAYNNNCKLSVCDLYCTDEDFNIIEKLKCDGGTLENGVYYSIDIILENLINHVDKWKWVVAWNKLYHKSLFSTVRYPQGKYHEDEFVIVQIMFQSQKVAVVDKKLYCYTQRAGSIMSSNISWRRFNYFEALFNRISFLYDNKMYQYIKMYEDTVVKIAFREIIEIDFQSKQCRNNYYDLAKAYRKAFNKINKYCNFSTHDLWLRVKLFYIPKAFILKRILKGLKNNVR